MIDSVPVPVVGFAHACGRHRWRGVAAYGYNAAQKQTLYGFKLHLLATHSGLILDFALVPANVADGCLTTQLLSAQAHLTVLGDKAYYNAPLQERLRQEQAIALLAPPRTNARVPLPAPLLRLMAHVRQAKTLNSQLAMQFTVEHNRAKSPSGLYARIQAKLCAHTLGLFLNQRTGQPLLALKPLALI